MKFQKIFMRSIIILFCLMVFSSIVNLPVIWAGDPILKGLSSGELLKYSLKDLRERIRNINLENQKLSQRNLSLRKRILVYQQEVRRLDDVKIGLNEKQNELKSDNQVDQKEVSVWQMKWENAQLLFDQLKERKKHLVAFVQEQSERNESLEKKANVLVEGLKTLRSKTASQKEPAPDPAHVERIKDMKNELKEIRSHIGEMRKKVAGLNKKVAGVKGQQERLSQENDGLTDRLGSVRASLKKAVNSHQELKEEARGLKNRADINVSEENTNIGQRRHYRNNLLSVIEKHKVVAKDIDKHYCQQQKQIQQWLNRLARQNELLIQKKEVLTKGLDSLGRLDKGIRQSINVKQKKESVGQELDKLVRQKEVIQEELLSARQKGPELIKKSNRLNREIRRLQARLKKTNNKTHVLQKMVNKTAERELLSLSEKEKQDIQRLQNNISDATGKMGNLNNKVLLARSRREENTEDLRLLQTNLEKVTDQHQQTWGRTQKLKNQASVNISEEKTNIGQWLLYRNRLKDAVEEQQVVVKKVDTQNRQQQKQISQWQDSLVKQNELLLHKKDVLQDVLSSGALLNKEIRQDINMRQMEEGLEQDLQKLVEQKEGIQERVLAAGGENPKLIKKSNRLNREIRRLQARLKKDSNKTHGLQQKLNKTTKDELSHLSGKERQNIQQLQNKISVSTKKDEMFNDRVLLARSRQEEMTKDLKLFQEQLSGLGQEQKDIEKIREESSRTPDQALKGIKKDIQDLKLQRDVIESSLGAIKSRYNQQESAIDEFTDEEGQLDEYLAILKTENNGLKEKVRSLEKSLEISSP